MAIRLLLFAASRTWDSTEEHYLLAAPPQDQNNFEELSASHYNMSGTAAVASRTHPSTESLDPLDLNHDTRPAETISAPHQPLMRHNSHSSGSNDHPKHLSLSDVSVTELAESKARKNNTLTNAERIHVTHLFAVVFVKIFAIFLAVVSIYWGSMFKRDQRYTNLKSIVVLSDAQFTVNGTTLNPLIGTSFIDMVTTDTNITNLLGWEVRSELEVMEEARKRNNTLEQELRRQVHHQDWWAAVHIRPNATELFYTSLAEGNASFANATSAALIDIIYEQGRHYSALTQYVQKHLVATQEQWLKFYTSERIYKPVLGNLTTTQRSSLVESNATLSLLNSPPTFRMEDILKNLVASMLGPSQLGLIYAQIFSFHQFNFLLQIHQYLKTKLRFRDYVVYRLMASQVNYLVLSLVYALITIAFQIPVQNCFGRAGFMVLWMFMFMFISASGGINENVVTYIISHDQKAWLAPWMVFYVMLNISPTFSALELCPNFYRYGYAMPMFNVFEALKVVFFDTYKGTLGRNMGVLAGWIGFTNILLAWNMKHVSNMEHRAKAKKAQEDKSQ